MSHRSACLTCWFVVLAFSPRTQATPCSPNSEWNSPFDVATAGASTQPTDNTSFVTMASYTYASSGTTVYKIDNSNGTRVWERNFASTIHNAVTPVVLRTGVEVVFVASDDGFLYKLSSGNGNVLASFDSRRRDGSNNLVCANDAIRGMPAVILYDFASSTFQNTIQDDLVVFPTLNGCGDTQGNRIIALKAANFSTPAWVFSAQGVASEMDFAAAGCALDYAHLRAYCTTNASLNQPTLWALNLLTGALVWSKRLGSIRTVAQLTANRLIVVTYAGALWARNADTGAAIWNLPIFSATGTHAIHNPWREFRNGYDGAIMIADNNGTLHRVTEARNLSNEYFASKTWESTLGSSVTSSAAVHADYGMGYVGLSNGKVSQVNLYNGSSMATLTVGTGLVYPPAMGMLAGTASVNRMVVANGDVVKRYCVPLENGAMGTFAPLPGAPAPRATGCMDLCEVNVEDSACGVCACYMAGNLLYVAATNNGGACTPRMGRCDSSQLVGGQCPLFGSSGACQASICTADHDDNPCTGSSKDGDRCNGTGFCCAGSCVNTQTSSTNCGACNYACPGTTTCTAGECV